MADIVVKKKKRRGKKMEKKEEKKKKLKNTSAKSKLGRQQCAFLFLNSLANQTQRRITCRIRY
jgi:hypothetical protein